MLKPFLRLQKILAIAFFCTRHAKGSNGTRSRNPPHNISVFIVAGSLGQIRNEISCQVILHIVKRGGVLGSFHFKEEYHCGRMTEF